MLGFYVKEITKKEAKDIVKEYHYLGNKDFLFYKAFGLFNDKDELIGASTFGRTNGISSLKGWFGLSNSVDESTGFYELNRLVLSSEYNGKNYGSFLLGRSLRMLKKLGVKAVISLADSSKHTGYVYQACNFSYHGKTSRKTDFYNYIDDNLFKLNPIGKTCDKKGVWINRSVKHRYLYLIDKNVNVMYKKESYPKNDTQEIECCSNSQVVYDKRFNMKFTCPICTKELKIIDDIEK